jgi:hypothetical protein
MHVDKQIYIYIYAGLLRGRVCGFRPCQTYILEGCRGKANKHAGPAQCRRGPCTHQKKKWTAFHPCQTCILEEEQAKQTSTQGQHSAKEDHTHKEQMDGMSSLSDIHSRRVRRQSEQACRASTVQKRALHTQNKKNGRHSVLVRYSFLKKAQAKQTSTQDKHSAEERQAHQEKMDSVLPLSVIHSRRVH